jgi:hypothetical protein
MAALAVSIAAIFYLGVLPTPGPRPGGQLDRHDILIGCRLRTAASEPSLRAL